MDVLLIRPSYTQIYHRFRKSAKFQVCAPPTGILFVAGMLRANGINVQVLDAEIENMSSADVVRFVKQHKPRIVGLTATTPEMKSTQDLIDKLVKKLPEVTVVLGGPHCTIMPDEAARTGAHYAVRGEGELTFLELSRKIIAGEDPKDILGISYLRDRKVIHNPPRPLIDDLDTLPYQARDLVPMHKYRYPSPGKGLVPFIVMLTTRGCPYQCIFCEKLDGIKVRYRSPENVVEEIETLYRNYGASFFQFNDETFILDHKRVHRICDMIIERNLDIKWYCMIRANLVTRELLSKMKKAGCVRISMGVETGNEKIMKILNKGATLEHYRKAYRLAKELGIETRGSFIIGNPYDTEETIKDTIRFAKSLALDEAYFNIMTPYPGTKVYEMAKKGQGLRLLTEDWSKYTRWGNAVIELPSLSREDLIRWQMRATRSFYLRPRKVWHQMTRMGIKDTIKAAPVYLEALFRK